MTELVELKVAADSLKQVHVLTMSGSCVKVTGDC